MIIGQWSSNYFLWYIRIQVRNPRKGISDLTVTTQVFYQITEAEVTYYTMGQPGIQSHRLHIQ